MQNSEQFLKLYEDLSPLKKRLASTVDYKKLRFSFEDILGLLDDKLIHVFLKYQDTHEYEEIKALAISSLTHMRARIYRQYGRESSLEMDPQLVEEETYEVPSMEVLMNTLSKTLPKKQFNLAKVIIDPPVYVLSRVNDLDKRIPSHLYLDFLGMPSDKPHVKLFNRFRRSLRSYIQERVDPVTFELRPS
jgi:hypothetical protein